MQESVILTLTVRHLLFRIASLYFKAQKKNPLRGEVNISQYFQAVNTFLKKSYTYFIVFLIKRLGICDFLFYNNKVTLFLRGGSAVQSLSIFYRSNQMATKYSVALLKIIRDNSLETVFLPDNAETLSVVSMDVNRPGLIFAGHEDHFDSERIEFIGLTEMSYLNALPELARNNRLRRLFELSPPAIIVTRSLPADGDMLLYAKQFNIPLLRTDEPTSSIMATLISYLAIELAQRITRHGVLVEVFGEGVLILGDSGVGKSETAVELIKRGHRLIADDAVEIRKVSSKTLVGSAPDNIRHFIELRGVGVINARNIFGVGAVKITEKIDMVVQLEQWDKQKAYDRMGIEENYINILDIKVPATVVPVKPGRNLSIIIEIAAINNRQKKLGYNAAKELLQQLGMSEGEPVENELEVWH